MTIKVLIFDIGGTVFDWNTAIVETLNRLVPERAMSGMDRLLFATACRAGFLDLNGRVTRGEKPWMTADEILQSVMDECCNQSGLRHLPDKDRLERLSIAGRTKS